MDIESAPLYVHKLNTKTSYLLLTNRLIYSVNDEQNILSIISTQLSECRLDGDSVSKILFIYVLFTFQNQCLFLVIIDIS